MAVMTSWSTSWHHCSTADVEVCGSGGLLRSWRVATNLASVVTAGHGVTAVVAKRWHDTMGAVWTRVMLTERLSACRDCATMEQEVASPSVPYSQREG
jgi:hypothetical protein